MNLTKKHIGVCINEDFARAWRRNWTGKPF